MTIAPELCHALTQLLSRVASEEVMIYASKSRDASKPLVLIVESGGGDYAEVTLSADGRTISRSHDYYKGAAPEVITMSVEALELTSAVVEALRKVKP